MEEKIKVLSLYPQYYLGRNDPMSKRIKNIINIHDSSSSSIKICFKNHPALL